MKWRPVGTDVPEWNVPLLCAWRVSKDFPGGSNGWIYGVAMYNNTYWHDPEDDEDDFAPPHFWKSISQPPTPIHPERSMRIEFVWSLGVDRYAHLEVPQKVTLQEFAEFERAVLLQLSAVRESLEAESRAEPSSNG